jgi:hypothetical protein
MTLLVAAVGCDGIVLAADKTFLDLPEEDEEIDERLDGRKIIVLENHKVAYAFAGDYVSQLVGKKLKQILDSGAFQFKNIDQGLKDAADAAISAEWMNNHALNVQAKRKLLVALYGEQVGQLQLWSVDIKVSMFSSAERINGLVMTGARGNAARFFRHYFQYNLPMERLKFLAAHIVLAGHSWNGDIDGLDMVLVGETSGLKWPEESGKIVFRERFRQWDDITCNFLLDTTLRPA